MNGEAIEENRTRNRTIRDSVPAAFLSAIQFFNRSKYDRHVWLQYLPGPSALQDFFATIDINRYLVDKEILFSHTGKLMKPSELIHMPPEFRFQKIGLCP